MGKMGVAGAEGREGASGGPRQDSALTLNELGAIAGFWAEQCRIWPKFQQGHSGCCIENGFQGAEGEAGEP